MRLCDGCLCVGAEEICGVPSPNPCRSEENAVPSAHPIQALPYRNEGKRRLPNQPASQARRSQTECPSRLKKVKRLTYEATPNSARVNKLCFQPAQAHPRIRYRRIHVL